tara:strand:+ start:67 stop:426 length:360 start_codon:yes stop_codon:yes gene_type:complete
MDEKLSWVYMTCGSLDEARKLGQVILEKNLAACVNILDGMRSLYRWEGTVQEDQEILLIAKTRHKLMDELTETVLANHSYECPCIIELPIDGGNQEFLQWIVSETKGGSKNQTDQKSQN